MLAFPNCLLLKYLLFLIVSLSIEFLLKSASSSQEAEFLVLTDCPSGPGRTIVPQSGRSGDEGSPWPKYQIVTFLPKIE